MKKQLLLTLLFRLSNLIAQPNGVDIVYGSHASHRLDYTTATNPNSPILMVVHGGGWSAGDKAHPSFTSVAQFFKNAGYAVVNINYRLSSEAGYPGHPAIPQDVSCAIAWTKLNAGVINGDSSRVIMYGHSAGAHLCMLHGLTHPQSLLGGCGYNAGLNISAVIAANPPVNFDYINPARYADIKPMVLDSANYWNDAEPAHHLANGNKTKFMIIVGQGDGFLGTQQSLVFNDSMSTYDYCKRFYFVPGTHTSFLNVNDTMFLGILAFADSLWAGQLCASPTDITENRKNTHHLELYPNPVRDKISIKGVDLNGPFDVYVVDVLGGIQFHSCVETEFSLAGLPTGLYTLHVKQGNIHVYDRFIKE